MKLFTIMLGLNDKDTKTQLVREADVLHNVEQMLAITCWGWTVSQARWVYKHDYGTIVCENSIRIETLGFVDEDVVREFIQELKTKYNQESVLLMTQELDVDFI